MDLYGIVYVSAAIIDFEEAQLARLLGRSRAHNQAAGITGALLYGGSRFLQVLEGSVVAVQALYERIAADPRHGQFELLANGPVARREFAGWHMSFAALTPSRFDGMLGYLSPSQLLRQGRQATVQQVLREFLAAGAQYPVG